MKHSGLAKTTYLLPAAFALAALIIFAIWLGRDSDKPLALRVPGTDRAPDSELGTNANAVLLGKLIRSDGEPADLPGDWPQFRGSNRDAINPENTPLARSWAPGQPRELWALDVGEGYAGAAILKGRVYLMDYDREHKQDALRCLSLADGREIWRFAYPVSVKRNHGMSRTVPAVTDQIVVAMGPKCHVVCLNPTTGELLWGLDLVRQFGATVPPWYAGQCPLIDNGAVILAPGGEDALLVALDGQTGKVLWQTPNPRAWKMTHASIMPMEFAGQRMYVYCASKGVVGVSAKDGSLLWETPDWKISIATVPSPLPLEGGRIFLTGGYNAGSLMLQLTNDAGQFAGARVPASSSLSGTPAQVRARGKDALPAESGHFVPEILFKLAPEVFGATQHTPILYGNHLYGVRADGKFVCLTLDGKVVWTSGSAPQFGLGPFIMADNLILAVNDSGLLRLFEANTQKYSPLAQAQVLKGRESWAPLALAGSRLIARDLTRMVCLDLPLAR